MILFCYKTLVNSDSYRPVKIGPEIEVFKSMKSMAELRSNIRFILGKLGLLMFFSVLLVMSSCQYKKPIEFNVAIQDLIRKNHSKELLNRKSYKKNIKIFFISLF